MFPEPHKLIFRLALLRVFFFFFSVCPECEASYQPNKRSRKQPVGKQTEKEEGWGVGWGTGVKGIGGMFTSVLWGTA